MADKFRPGDLTEIGLVVHTHDGKKIAIVGKFKGSDADHILARVGEGENDLRSAELIKLTAECVMKEISDLHGLMAFKRDLEERKNAGQEK